MRTMIAVLAVATATSILLAQALARPSSDSPSSGGISQTVTLTLLGFSPVKKPKVQLVPHAGATGLKTVNMKVLTFTSTEIGAQVTTGLAGVYDVLVKPTDRGVAPVTLPDTFTILVPAPASVDPTTGPGITVVTIHGATFGTPKGKVTIGGRKAKVKSWADDTIVAVVSKSTPAGAQPVVVTNKAGPSDGQLTFTVTGSSTGGGGNQPDEYIRADLSGRGHFDGHSGKVGSGLFVVTWTTINSQLTFAGSSKPLVGYPSLAISMTPLDVTQAKPFHVGPLPNPPSVLTLATLNYTEATPAIKTYTAAAAVPGASLDIVVTGWDGTFLEGTFSGTLVDFGGSAPIVVTNGTFRTRRETGH